MSSKKEIFDNHPADKPLREVVSVPISLSKSLQGVYFVGQTPQLSPRAGEFTWAALVNPEGSGKNLFVNVFTISDFSPNQITAELWLNAKLPGKPSTSPLVSSSNTTIKPLPESEVLIEYVESTKKLPQGGVNIFDRIVPPNNTVVAEEDGKYIIPPGGNFAIFLKPSMNKAINAIVAFGWWLEDIHCS